MMGAAWVVASNPAIVMAAAPYSGIAVERGSLPSRRKLMTAAMHKMACIQNGAHSALSILVRAYVAAWSPSGARPQQGLRLRPHGDLTKGCLGHFKYVLSRAGRPMGRPQGDRDTG